MQAATSSYVEDGPGVRRKNRQRGLDERRGGWEVRA